MNTDAYKALVATYYDQIWKCSGLQKWEAICQASALDKLAALDAQLPKEDNKRSKIKLYANLNTALLAPTLEEHHYPYGGTRWNTKGHKSIPNQQIGNVFFNDIIEIQSLSHGYSGGEQRKMNFLSARFGVQYKMMLREFNPTVARQLTRGVLIGNFTFSRTGGYLGLKMIELK